MKCFNILIFSYLKLLNSLLIFVFLYNKNILSLCVIGRNCYLGLKCLNCMAFVPTHSLKPNLNKDFRLNSGWGVTDKYSWKEDDRYVYISSSLGPNLKSSQINVNLSKDSIKVEKNNSKFPIIEGKTRGKVDVDNSFWTLEDQNGLSELQITLKKSQPFNQEWFGVLYDEKIQLKDYHGGTEYIHNLTPNSVEPNEIYCTKIFPSIDSKKLQEMFIKWMKKDSNPMVPFGKPNTDIGFEYLSDKSGDKLLYLGLEQDEYMKLIIKSKEKDVNSSELVLINGPRTEILKGLYGLELKDKLIRSLNTFIGRFESDVNRLVTLISSNKSSVGTYDYSGSYATLSPKNLEDYINYHKSIESIMKRGGETTNRIQNENVKEELSKDENERLKKETEINNKAMRELTEVINQTENKKPKEQIKSIITNLKKNLCLDTLQVDDLFKNAVNRINREVEESKQKEEEIIHVKPSDSWFTEQMEPKTIIERTSDPFYSIMNNPENRETSLLVKKYHSIGKTQQEKLRERWNNNAKRLKLLINELFEAPPELVSTICNNYRELLISEDYPTLMKSYIINNGVKNELEKSRLNFLNEFVLSIYKDAEIYTCKDEQYQLSKIKQICEWAMKDFENINDHVERNKHLYDVNFMSYIRLLISKETERMDDTVGLPTPEKNPWLSILTIIEIAIRSMIEKEIEEDIYVITNIVHMKIPKVRTHMTEFILATMPRSDWKSFKDLVFSITDELINKPPEERDMGNVPEWVPEACFQLRKEIESMIPDWIIDELLSENDKMLMIQNNRKKSPVLQLDLENRYKLKKGMEQPAISERIKIY